MVSINSHQVTESLFLFNETNVKALKCASVELQIYIIIILLANSHCNNIYNSINWWVILTVKYESFNVNRENITVIYIYI